MPKAPGGLPDIDQFLPRPVRNCIYIRSTTAQIREPIEAKVAAGGNEWAGFARYLKACGVDVPVESIKQHYYRHTDGH